MCKKAWIAGRKGLDFLPQSCFPVAGIKKERVLRD